MEFFLNEILTDPVAVQAIWEREAEWPRAKAVAEYILRCHETPELASGMFPLLVLGFLADAVRAQHEQMEISHDVTLDTLRDVNVWIENYRALTGETGLGEFHWLIFSYTGRLFKLGRLQFRLIPAPKEVPAGAFAIETHVQQGAPLDPKACEASLAWAEAFFREHFPSFPAEYFVCDSWLLNPCVEELVGADSNITRFMKRWTPFPMEPDASAQAIERVFGFGFTKNDLAVVPQKTHLQKALKAYLQSGKELDICAGYRKIGK